MAFWDKWIQSIASWITQNGWNQRPTSAVFIAVSAILISLVSAIATRLLIDVKSLQEDMKKINEWNQRRKQAMETADKKLWLRVKRDEERIKKLQSSMMMKRFKPTLVTFIPFLIIFAILRAAFHGHYYALLPFNIGNFPWIGKPWFGQPGPNEPPNQSKVPFILWYFITSYAFGAVISKLFGAMPSGATNIPKKGQKKKNLSVKQKHPSKGTKSQARGTKK